MAADFAEKHRNTLFSNNVTATLRQTPGMYPMLCGSTASYTGNQKARIENRFGRLKMQPKVGRNTDTNHTDIDSIVRFIKPGPQNVVATLLDKQDYHETLVDLGAPLVKEVAEAARTYHDDMTFAGFFGNGYSGADGDMAETFKSANIIAHGGVGLTKDKLIALREMMRKRNAPYGREMPIILLHPEDESDLLAINEYVNQDFTSARPLELGEIKPWMGFRYVAVNPDSESLPQSFASFFTDSGTTRNLPVIFPSGLHRGVWQEFDGRVSERDDKDYSTQYWGAARSAVVRTDEDLAFMIRTK